MVAYADEAALSPAEQKLDNLALAFEDVAEALAMVQDLQDADLIASRVAVDFIMLRPLHAEIKALKHNPQVRPEMAQRFFSRCAAARKQALAIIAELNKTACHGSAALPAAISLAGLMDGSLSAEKAAVAAMELKINNMERMVDLLVEVNDAASAAAVAPMMEYANVLGNVLSDFADEYESTPLPEESALYFARRVEDYHVDLANVVSRIQSADFYGNEPLRALLSSPEPPC